MARIRTIKPEFFKDHKLYQAERDSGLPLRVAFAGLWTCADREGRFLWEPEELKVACLPYDQIDFSRVLDALASRDLLVKYACKDGRKRVIYGLIRTFKKHQVVNNKERPSELPSPSDEGAEIIDVEWKFDASMSRDGRDEDAKETRDDRVTQGKERKGREGNSEDKSSGADAPLVSRETKPSSPNLIDEGDIPLSLIRIDNGDYRKVLWNQGIAFVARMTDKTVASCRSIVGGWCKQTGDDHRRLWDLLVQAERDGAVEIISWMQARILSRDKGAGSGEGLKDYLWERTLNG